LRCKVASHNQIKRIMSVIQQLKDAGGITAIETLLNESLIHTTPTRIVLSSVGVGVFLSYIYSQLTHKYPLYDRIKHEIFRQFRRLPFVKKQIDAETSKTQVELEKEFLKYCINVDELDRLPEKGMSVETVLKEAKSILALGDGDWKTGSESGTVYNGNDILTDLMTNVYGMSAWSNPLHPDTFPGIRKMEAEIVRMCCSLFNGDPTTSCGCMTTGGTESIVLACKAYRDWAKEEKGIKNPVIIAPITAHAAFDKAAAMLDMPLRKAPVDPVTQKVDIRQMRKLICSSTCMLVGSAPQFPHGSIDEIGEIAKLGRSYGIPVHVDACLGGFLIPFMNDAGFPLEPFDFRVPGVTSISADTHKYGFAPKGSSVILYSEPIYRHYQWFSFVDWPGGIYATTTISGSRAGGIIAACWASLVYHGRQGYVESTKQIIETTRYITEEMEKIDGIFIVGKPEVSVVAIGSNKFNIYGFGDLMKEGGWNLNILQEPACVHLCCTMLHAQSGVADRFINDVKVAVKKLLDDPSIGESKTAALYGSSASVSDRGIVDRLVWTYLDSLYVTKSTQKKIPTSNGIQNGDIKH